MPPCQFCAREHTEKRPICRNLADMRSWAEAGDEDCERELKARLAKWTLSESGICLSRTTHAR